MATDAHAHPYDLSLLDAGAESLRWKLDLPVAASSWNRGEFVFQEKLAGAARDGGGPLLLLCFGVHPQLPSVEPEAVDDSLSFLHDLIREGRIDAVGEMGFDLFDERFKETEALQEVLFLEQAFLARESGIPAVLHMRKALHKAFAHSAVLKRLPSVVFHSWPGTGREAEDLLKRGVNAYFSFGSALMLGHRRPMEAVNTIPLERILLETDAPYQPIRGRLYPERLRAYSTWEDLALIRREAAMLRGIPEADLEAAVDRNFREAFGLASTHATA